jgi:hypothetical protein
MRDNETDFVGRIPELAMLERALTSAEAEMVAIIGRRRVGKTYLIRRAYERHMVFEMTGLQHGAKRVQLRNFADQLRAYSGSSIPLETPHNWQAAFQLLIHHLESLVSSEKQVIFFDEVPWIATPRSDFLSAFGLFWNSWASRKSVVVVICGSAASWMINKVVKNRGGLYNRITKRVFLKPFNLAETEHFLVSRGVRMDHYQILQVYMAMGGIPHYLKEVVPGKSAVQNVDDICFAEGGLLSSEFENLYFALFDDAARHIAIIRELEKVRKGLTRKEILKTVGLPDGGGATRVIDELSSSGFITGYYDFGKKRKGIRYRLTDEFSHFYLKFIEVHRNDGRGSWQRLSQTQRWKSWSGYAFENICLKHVNQIKEALRIGGVYSEASGYFHPGSPAVPGVQIDLLIDRNDHVINLCEIKFYNADFLLDKAGMEAIRSKMSLFKAATNTRKQLQNTLITTFPLTENQYSRGVIDQNITMDDLFAPARR